MTTHQQTEAIVRAILYAAEQLRVEIANTNSDGFERPEPLPALVVTARDIIVRACS